MNGAFDAPLARPVEGGRLVWNGRATWGPINGVDGWTCDRTSLFSAMAQASELLILDPLSFPWDGLRDSDRDIPLVVLLPQDVDLETIELTLGRSLLDHVTPFDRLLESRPGVRDALLDKWSLDPANWLPLANGDPDTVLDALEVRSNQTMIEVDTPFGRFVTPRTDVITDQLVEFGAHRRGALNVLLSLVDGSDVVWDIGAHIGTVSIPLVQAGSVSQVLAIEGNPQTAAILRRNVALNGVSDRVVALSRVLTAAPGEMVTARHSTSNAGTTGFDHLGTAGQLAVASATLDGVASTHPDLIPTLINLDVAGHELAVLTGGEETIAAHRPLLFVEVSSAQLEAHRASLHMLQNWFDQHHYRLFLVGGERNFSGPNWELEPLDGLASSPDPLFDVLAVPHESTALAGIQLSGSFEYA
jgi:FkbM family methyltransferase